MKSAVFCGSFNPMTLGHLDILKKAGRIFDKVYVAIPTGSSTDAERIKIASLTTSECSFAQVISFSGLLTDFCKALNTFTLVRGIRNNTDFTYECDLLRGYQTQAELIDCVYFVPSPHLAHISSSIVRELAAYGGNLQGYIARDAIPLVQSLYKKP